MCFLEWTLDLESHSCTLSGCTPQAYKACTCPVSRLKKEPRVNNRDINGLMDGGAYTSEANPGVTPYRASYGGTGQDRTGQQFSLLWGKGRLPVMGGIDLRWAHWLPGNQQRGTPLTIPLIRTVTSWGLGASM